MTTNPDPAEAGARRAKWLEEAASFLKDKSAEELYHIYQIFAEVEHGEGIEDRFVSATRALFANNVELALETSRLLLTDEREPLREEVYWVVKDIMFTNLEAMTMTWDTLLSDPSDNVFNQVYQWASEDYHDAEDAPLSSLLYAGERLLQTKDRYEGKTQTPR